MKDNEKVIIKNEYGEEKEYSILITFDIESKNKSYVLFTDYSQTENGDLKIYYAIYDKSGKDLSLKEVEEKDEIEIIEKYIKKLEIYLKSGIKFS